METLVFGRHAVQSLLKHNADRVLRVLIQKGMNPAECASVVAATRTQGLSLEYVSREQLDRLAEDGNHQGVIAVCKPAMSYTEKDLQPWLQSLASPPFLLLLDGVQDPRNLGACFRIADAAGVQAIIAPKDKATGLTGVVSKVASGATETVPFFQVTNLARSMEILKEEGVWLYGADSRATDSQSLYEISFPKATGIVMGGEGEGLRRLTRERCDAILHIPMHGTVESLNVSVATGIILFEVARKRSD
jgi:23S rRNA (guanosine2251-2'-O)-methyltransferase